MHEKKKLLQKVLIGPDYYRKAFLGVAGELICSSSTISGWIC